ncbi:MAG: VWA domain-containing protein [Eubacterium sp.]|nr:VWA domain-containing protein [Eubacterium sp.]
MKKIFLTIIAMLCFSYLLQLKVYAADSYSIIYTIISNEIISAYINNPDISNNSVFIGTTPCEITSYSRAEDLPSDTLILVDASGSIPKEIQEKTSAFLSELIDGKIENERYAIASFGTDITYLCDYTSDRYELSKAAEKLDYSEKYTYIYSNLDSVLKNIGSEVFEKIIVISDGMENSKDGITYDEILRTVSETSCPIYTVGIENNNQENLKKFYSFSRNSAAQSFTLTSDTDVSEVCGIVNECRNYTCVTIDIPSALADGSVKYLKINGGNFECGVDIRMPVAAVSNTEITVTETISETTPVQEEIAVPHKKINLTLIIGIAAAALIISAIVIIIFKMIEKKGERSEQAEPAVVPSSTDTIIDDVGDITIIENCAIKLTDINAPERSFQCALGNGVIIGRDANKCMIVIDDGHISRVHCKIFQGNGKFYIENLSEKQNVFINEKYILDKAGGSPKNASTPSTGTKILLPTANSTVKEIFNGDIIRIGHTSMRFEILK